jgi:hypothetical protein
MTNNCPITAAYLAASADLLESAITHAQREDHDAVAGLGEVLRAGGLLKLAATFASSTGLALVQIDVLTPSGDLISEKPQPPYEVRALETAWHSRHAEPDR